MKRRTLKSGYFIEVIFFIIITSFCSFPENQKPITVVFRYDDYSYNISIEKYIIEVFNKYNVPVTFGVVQGGDHLCSTDISTLKELDKKNKVEIAMHGYAHSRTELLGSYDEQYKLLAKGKEFLEKSFDTKVVTFVPPYDHYTLNTLKVLNKLNFKVISSDKTGPFDNSKIIFMPFTSTLTSLKSDIASVRNSKYKQCIIIVLFHHYDFDEDNKALGKISKKKFADLVKWVSEQNDIDVKSLGKAADLIDSKNFDNYNKVHSLYIFRFLPFDQHRFDLDFYPSVLLFKHLKTELYVFLILYHSLILVLLAGITYFIFYNILTKKISANIPLLLIILMLICSILIPVRFLGSFIAAISGTVIGILLSNYRLKLKSNK